MATHQEVIFVYLGPTLPLSKAREILPQGIYRPPAKQGDILSDLTEYEPTHIILIDGCFRETFSVWHKEIVYALQYPSVQRIIGAASIGAVRASECDFLGMVGVGQIYQWYKQGVTEDDSEVALSFAQRDSPLGPIYYPLTVPLCNIRAGLDGSKNHSDFFDVMQATHYTERTPRLCAETWGGPDYPHLDQKAIDAAEALGAVHTCKPQVTVTPSTEHLSTAFSALYDRDRRIKIDNTWIPQQHIDAYCLLNNPEYERICWDSANQELALLFCNYLHVTVSVEEIQRESDRFHERYGIQSEEDFRKMLHANGWNTHEYQRLQVQNARIRKLQHALTISKVNRRNTCAILDYLRTYQGYDYWAKAAAQAERVIQHKGVDDWQSLDLDKTAWHLLDGHCDAEGLEVRCNQEEYLLETGFVSAQELAVAIMRLAHAKEED